MTDLYDLEVRLDKILHVLEEMNDRSKYFRLEEAKQILDELKEMNARDRVEEYKKKHPSDSNREDHET
jgi:G3E family GTPase